MATLSPLQLPLSRLLAKRTSSGSSRGITAVEAFLELPGETRAKVHERMARLHSLYPDLDDWLSVSKMQGNGLAHQLFYSIDECIALLELNEEDEDIADPDLLQALLGLQSLNRALDL